jgi:hypothetical protein
MLSAVGGAGRGEGGDAVSDDPERERLARAVEDNMTRVAVARVNLDEALEAVRVCVRAEADYMRAGRDWQASVMALRDAVCALDYDARHPRGGEEVTP